MKRKHLLRASLFALALTACSDHSQGDLARMVDGDCYDLEQTVAHASERHHKLASAIDEKRLSDDQLQRANDELALESVGTTPDVRRARMHELETRFHYCVAFHQIPDKRADELSTELEKIHESMNQAIMSGAMPSAAQTAAGLDQFHTLVHEVNAAPLKN